MVKNQIRVVYFNFQKKIFITYHCCHGVTLKIESIKCLFEAIDPTIDILQPSYHFLKSPYHPSL